VLIRDDIYEAFMTGPENAIELFHGYTYSGHPLACAAALATLDVYARENLFERAAEMAPLFEEAVHSLKGTRHVIDIRNLGMMAAVELAPLDGKPGARGFAAFLKAQEKGLLIRVTGDIIALSPPLIVEKEQIETMVSILRDVLEHDSVP
jgi:beta-alanine--pyruvate transaminase